MSKHIERLMMEDLVSNPTHRLPVILVLDTSYSMIGEKMDELNEGVKQFINEIKSDELASLSAEIGVITFGDGVKKIVDFASVHRQDFPELKAFGYTPMGEAVNMAIDELEKRKQQYKNVGVGYFQPWMVLMTDGDPTDAYEQAANRLTNLIKDKKMTIFPIGIGNDANIDILRKFSPSNPPVKLKGTNFKAFFSWLSKSVAIRSASTPGEKFSPPPIQSWGEF